MQVRIPFSAAMCALMQLYALSARAAAEPAAWLESMAAVQSGPVVVPVVAMIDPSAVAGMAAPLAAAAPAVDKAAVAPLTASALADTALAGAQKTDRARLAQARGGSDTVSNDAQLSGVVGNNAAVNVTTGANTISANSFANASGLPVVIQNSGANVLIQNATIINLQLH
jgi:hypothetical protein